MNPFESIGNLFVSLFRIFAYQPELNALQLLFNATGDIGISIVLLALIANIILWPLFSKFYINSQKTRVLQPLMNQLRIKHKDSPQEYLAAVREFQRKHGINNSLFFYFIVLNILLISGVWTVTSDVGNNKIDAELYSFLFDSVIPQFSNTLAFGRFDISKSASELIWLPALTAFLSAIYGLYISKYAPKPPTLPVKKTKNKDKTTDTPEIDPAVLNKAVEIQSIYIMPLLLFFINYNLNIGSNIYALTLTIFSLLRQVYLSYYYKNHLNKLIDDIAASDPEYDDWNAIDVAIVAKQEVASKNLTADLSSKPIPSKQTKPKTSKKKVVKSTKSKKTSSKKTTTKK